MENITWKWDNFHWLVLEITLCILENIDVWGVDYCYFVALKNGNLCVKKSSMH